MWRLLKVRVYPRAAAGAKLDWLANGYAIRSRYDGDCRVETSATYMAARALSAATAGAYDIVTRIVKREGSNEGLKLSPEAPPT